MSDTPIDWTKFDRFPQDTCQCRCGAVFLSHAKLVMEGQPHPVTRRPCPGCGKNNDCRKVSSAPETFTVGGT